MVLTSLLGDVSYEWPMITSNSLLHTFMYPHSAGLWNAHAILMILGTWQLLVGLGFSIYAQVWGLLMCITYAMGYLNEHFHLIDRLIL